MRQIILLLLMLFLTSITYSQDSTYYPRKKGDFALQYQISAGLTVSEFGGHSLAAKYHIIERSAIRFGVSFSNEWQYEVANKGDNSQVNSSFYLQLQWIQNLYTNKDITAFIGAGLLYSAYGELFFEDKEYSRLTIFGGVFITGIEWYFRDDVCISLESGINLRYFAHNIYEEKYTMNYENLITSSSGMTKIGLSIYL